MDERKTWKKYVGAGIVALAVVILGLLFYFLLFFPQRIGNVLGTFLTAVTPILYGCIVALLLAPLCNKLELFFGWIWKKLAPKRKPLQEKTVRRLAVLVSVPAFAALLYLFFRILLPQVYQNIRDLIPLLTGSIKKVTAWADGFVSDGPDIGDTMVRIYQSAIDWVQNIYSNVIEPNIQSIVTALTSSIVQVVVVLKNLIIGLIVSVYLLLSRRHLSAQAKKVVYALFKKERAERYIARGKFTHKVFNGFVTGKILDSLIIGVLCFLCLSLMKMPYTLLVSVIVGVTNIVPFFGPFIGAIPSALLILLNDPIKCLYFVIFIIILQQLDGNIIGPRILGDSIGISSFCVIFSILLFGGLFGFAGMVFGVPLFAVLLDIVQCFIRRRLKKKELPEDAESYANK